MKTTIKILMAVLFSVTVFAQQAAPPPAQTSTQSDQLPATIAPLNEQETRLFERFDHNGDGMINQEEYRNQVVHFFEHLDKLHRGYVDEKEVQSADPDDLKNLKIDPTDKMSLEDFEKTSFSDFQKADANHDGQLSPDEFKTWLGIVKTRFDQDKTK